MQINSNRHATKPAFSAGNLYFLPHSDKPKVNALIPDSFIMKLEKALEGSDLDVTIKVKSRYSNFSNVLKNRTAPHDVIEVVVRDDIAKTGDLLSHEVLEADTLAKINNEDRKGFFKKLCNQILNVRKPKEDNLPKQTAGHYGQPTALEN